MQERDLPRYILVSDFARFRLFDLDADIAVEFKLGDLHKQVKHFGFIAGYRTQEIEPQNPVNIRAAEQMGKLHDLLKASGYTGHPLELLLVRLLFCRFADDTGIFQPAGAFRIWLDERTAKDGSDLGPQLAQLFQVLNQPDHARPKTLDDHDVAPGRRRMNSGHIFFEEYFKNLAANLRWPESILDSKIGFRLNLREGA